MKLYLHCLICLHDMDSEKLSNFLLFYLTNLASHILSGPLTYEQCVC